MTINEVYNIVTYLAQKFITRYNETIFPYQENIDILGNGYCLYFAFLLKQMIPEGEIYLCENHYLFHYQNMFFDYTGIVSPENKLTKIDNIQDELDMGDILGYTDHFRDQKWNKIESKLLEDGQKYKLTLTKKEKEKYF